MTQELTDPSVHHEDLDLPSSQSIAEAATLRSIRHCIGAQNFISAEDVRLTWSQSIPKQNGREVVRYKEGTIASCKRENIAGSARWYLVYCLPLTIRELYGIRAKQTDCVESTSGILTFSERISPSYFLDDYCVDWENSRPLEGYTFINLKPLFDKGIPWTKQTEFIKQKGVPYTRANLSLYFQTLSALFRNVETSQDDSSTEVCKQVLSSLKDIFLWSDLTYGSIDQRILKYIIGTGYKGLEMSPEWQADYMLYKRTFQFFGGLTSYADNNGTSVLTLSSEHILHSAGRMLNLFESLMHDYE